MIQHRHSDLVYLEVRYGYWVPLRFIVEVHMDFPIDFAARCPQGRRNANNTYRSTVRRPPCFFRVDRALEFIADLNDFQSEGSLPCFPFPIDDASEAVHRCLCFFRIETTSIPLHPPSPISNICIGRTPKFSPPVSGLVSRRTVCPSESAGFKPKIAIYPIYFNMDHRKDFCKCNSCKPLFCILNREFDQWRYFHTTAPFKLESGKDFAGIRHCLSYLWAT